MKNIITIIFCLLHIYKVYSQGCTSNTSDCEIGNGISTNPSNPTNPNCANMLNNFDWRVKRTDFLPEDYIVYGANAMVPIQNPFTGPSTAIHSGTVTNQGASNYQPEDGWELLKVEFGIQGNVNINNDPNFLPNQPTNYTKPKLPYMILYNKYSGTMRFFGSLLDANEDYETLEIKLNIPSENSKYFAQNSPLNPWIYNKDLKATNLLSIQGESIQPLDQETEESSISIFVRFTNNQNEFFWFDLPVAYDPCICNNKVQLDFSFKFVQTAQIALNQVVDDGIKNVNKPGSSGNSDYARMVFGRILAAGVSGALAIKTGGAIVNYKAFIDLVDIVKDHPSRNQTEKDNLNKLKNYLTCSEKMFSVVNGSFKDVTGKDEKKQIAAGQKILDANTTFLSSLVKGCSTDDNAATGSTEALKFSGTFTRSPIIGSTDFFMAMPGSNWGNTNLLPKDYVTNNTITPSFPTYNERLGVFALLETPKFDFNLLHETQITDDYIPIIMPTGKTVCNFKLAENFKYAYNPLLNVNNNKTKIYCRIVIKNINGFEFSNGEKFKIETVNNNIASNNGNNGNFCAPIRNSVNFENKFFESNSNSSFYVYSRFVDIDQFKDMPLTFSYFTNKTSNLTTLSSNVKENIFIQFKILLISNDIGTDGPINAFHLFTYPIELNLNYIKEPHLINTNSICSNYLSFINNTYLPQVLNIFGSNIPSIIDDNKDFNSDLIFNSDGEYIYDGIVTISAKLSTAHGKKVKIYSTMGFELEPGAEISPDIELIVGLPLVKIPQPPQTYAQVSAFCGNNNKYKAQTFSQSAIQREKEEYEARQISEQEAIKQKTIVSFKLSPNPTSSNFKVSIFNNNEKEYSIVLMDGTGKVLMNNSYSGSRTIQNIETNGMASGIYFVKIICGNTQKTEKLFIQN